MSCSQEWTWPLYIDPFTSELDCKRYGVVVKQDKKQGVLLPDLDGVDTVDRQIQLCMKKGNIKASENYELYRFEVQRYRWLIGSFRWANTGKLIMTLPPDKGGPRGVEIEDGLYSWCLRGFREEYFSFKPTP